MTPMHPQTKQLKNLPPRVLRFSLSLNGFDYSILLMPSKYMYMYTADSLSQSPIPATFGDTGQQQNQSWRCVSITNQLVFNAWKSITMHKHRTTSILQLSTCYRGNELTSQKLARRKHWQKFIKAIEEFKGVVSVQSSQSSGQE